MAKYNDLSALRGALTADDPDNRAEAYSAVLNADVKPSDVLETEPADDSVQSLVDNDVVPDSQADDAEPAGTLRQQQTELLKEIRDAVTGGE